MFKNMNKQNSGETQVEILTNICQNVCTFIRNITEENKSQEEKIQSSKTKIDDLQCQCVDLKMKLDQINVHVKTLANLLNFKISESNCVNDTLTQWILSLSNKTQNQKRKVHSTYSPLKLSLKDNTKVNDNIDFKSECIQFTKPKSISSQKKTKNVWKLQTKHNGNPSDLLKKSKQTTLLFQPQEEKVKIDITTISTSTPKSSCPKVLNIENNDVTKNDNGQNSTFNTYIDECSNISLSHFNKIIKPNKSDNKTNILKLKEYKISHDQSEKHDVNTLDDTIYSPVKKLENTLISEQLNKIPKRNLTDSYDIIPGLNGKLNDLPNYKFKEEPVRKQNERKLLNGWDCEDCCKFYKANNENPIEAKNAMNHFSRHRSIKNQLHAPTPPGFWDPI